MKFVIAAKKTPELKEKIKKGHQQTLIP